MSNFKVNNYSDILSSQAYHRYSQGDLIEGINLFSNIIGNNPHDSNIWVELGFAHLKNLDFEMAKMCFETANKINPTNPSTICALGLYYYESEKYDVAEHFYNKTLKIDKNSEWAKLNLSLLEQTSGDYSKGLLLYEQRDKKRCLLLHKNFEEGHLTELKDLKTINGEKSILVIGEQGFGDQLMICLYLKKLNLLGMNITYLVNEKLYNLLKSVKELQKIKISKKLSKDELQSFDYKIYSMSLPFLFYKSKLVREQLKIDVSTLPRSFNDYPRKVKKLLSQKKLRVGIAWSGRSSQTRNSFRSVKLEFFNKILENKNINFFVMQKVSSLQDINIINNRENFFNFNPYLNDFTDTAFLLSKMDLVISTCTSLVHLAGLLDKKTYLLLSKVHDPRWNESKNGVIYKSVNKFKQKNLNNWFHALEEIKNNLEKYLK